MIELLPRQQTRLGRALACGRAKTQIALKRRRSRSWPTSVDQARADSRPRRLVNRSRASRRAGVPGAASADIRDTDGNRRLVARRGRTRAAADRALKTALADRTPPIQGTLSASTPVRELAERRDPFNLSRELRQARGSGEFAWVTSHVFRKTCATLLDEGELSARQIADQLGHAKVSMTQDNYLGRRLTNRRTAETLDRAIGRTLG
jgi:hypothetical protein